MIKIHAIKKSDLSLVTSISPSLAGMSNSSGMVISHYAYSEKQTNATIPFEMEIVREYVPIIKDIEFCVVLRTKVDLTAIGPNEETIKDIGNDIGKYDYNNSVPSIPLDLPPGFKELHRK